MVLLTVTALESLTVPETARIIAVPGPTAVTCPWLTVATAVLDDDHVSAGLAMTF